MVRYRQISLLHSGDVTIVRLTNRHILDTECIDELGSELLGLVAPNCKILLNFSDVEQLSSEAISKLIALHKRVQADEGSLSVSNISAGIQEVFRITHLDTLFDIRASEAEALASL